MEDKLFSVRDKICVITGGMGQLGAQYVKAFLSRGAKVAVFGRHVGEDKVQKVFEKDEYESPNLKFFQVDITSKSDLNKALDQMEEAWGTPDVLVNNAGIDTQPSAPPEVSGPFENFPEEVFREVVDVNLVGTFLTCQAVGARMVKGRKAGFYHQCGFHLRHGFPGAGYLRLQGEDDRNSLRQTGGVFRGQIRYLQPDPLSGDLLGKEKYPCQYLYALRRMA